MEVLMGVLMGVLMMCERRRNEGMTAKFSYFDFAQTFAQNIALRVT